MMSLYAFYQFFWGYKQIYSELLPYKDNFLIGKTLYYLNRRRVSSTFALPTAFAAFQLMSIPLLLYFGLFCKSIKKILAFFAVALCFISSVLSQSYFIVIALLIMMLIFACIKKFHFPKVKLIAILFILMIIAAIFTVKYRHDLPVNILKANTIQMRLGNWRIAKDMIMDNLIWGVGIDNFQLYYPKFMSTYDIETKYAHNFFLQFCAELGIVGIAFVVALVFILFFSFFKIRKIADVPIRLWAIASSVFIFFAYSLIDISFYFPSIGFYGVLIISLYVFEYKRLKPFKEDERIVMSSFVKIFFAFVMFVIIIYSGKLYFAESMNMRAYNYLVSGKKEEAVAMIKDYLKFFKSDVSASEIMIHSIKDEKQLKEKIYHEEYLLSSFPFSPKTHYMVGIINLSDYRYYNAFINFSIAHQLYPIKNTYKDYYLKTQEIIMILNEKKEK